jgi:hypothetical protein
MIVFYFDELIQDYIIICLSGNGLQLYNNKGQLLLWYNDINAICNVMEREDYLVFYSQRTETIGTSIIFDLINGSVYVYTHPFSLNVSL